MESKRALYITVAVLALSAFAYADYGFYLSANAALAGWGACGSEEYYACPNGVPLGATPQANGFFALAFMFAAIAATILIFTVFDL